MSCCQWFKIGVAFCLKKQASKQTKRVGRRKASERRFLPWSGLVGTACFEVERLGGWEERVRKRGSQEEEARKRNVRGRGKRKKEARKKERESEQKSKPKSGKAPPKSQSQIPIPNPNPNPAVLACPISTIDPVPEVFRLHNVVVVVERTKEGRQEEGRKEGRTKVERRKKDHKR
jgi:hypothetical protein